MSIDITVSAINSAVEFIVSTIKEQFFGQDRSGFTAEGMSAGDRAYFPEKIKPDINSVLDAMRDAHDFETKRRDERLRQARLSFNAALVLLIVGTLVVLTGVVLLFRNQNITAGIVTSAAGVISNFFSAILFKFSRDANDRLDKIKTNLAKIEAYQQTLTAISENRKAASQQQKHD